MSDKNLFLGDTTYQHDSRAAEWLRSKYGAYRGHHAWRDIEAGFNAGLTLANSNAADRIEQLERKLAEAQEDAERYRFIRNISDGVIGLAGVPCVAMPNGMSSGYYLNAEHADFAIDAAIQEWKA